MYTEEERAKWRERVARWRNGELVYDAGRIVEKSDNTSVQKQEPVLPIKRDFVAEATRKHAAEAVGPDTRSLYLREQSQSAKQYANQQYQKAKDDAKRAEGLKNLLTLTQPSTYIEAATGKDLGDVGRFAADLAFGGVVTVPKKISSKAIKDAAYKAAVESGNKQEAYRLLEEAYLNSGVQKTPITITSDGKAVGWYHGSEWGNHTIFDSSAMNATIGGTSAAGKIKGNFLTTDVPSAMRYAGHGRYTLPNVPEYTSPQNFVEKLQNFFGMYKSRKLYPAERVGEYAPRPERLFDTEGKPPIDHLSKTDNVVYPMYVNPGENPMIVDFKGNPWSRSPVEFPNKFYLKRWVRDDAAKTYRNEIVPFKNYDDALKAWNEDPINVRHGKSSLKELYFDDGIRSIEGFNSAPRYETVKLVEERVPNTTNGAVLTAAREGNTSVLIRNVIDSNGGPEGTHYAIDDLVTLKPELMKLADITYDDTGNLIPLSQRFNWNLKDIRYGMIPLLGGAGYAASLPKYEDGGENIASTGAYIGAIPFVLRQNDLDTSKNKKVDELIANKSGYGWDGNSRTIFLNSPAWVKKNINPAWGIIDMNAVKVPFGVQNMSGATKDDNAFFLRHLGYDRDLESMPVTGIRFAGDYNSDGSLRLPDAEYTGLSNRAKDFIRKGIIDGKIKPKKNGDWTMIDEKRSGHSKLSSHLGTYSIRENNGSGIYDVVDTYDFPWYNPILNRQEGKQIEVRDTIHGPNAKPNYYNFRFSKKNNRQ